MGKWKFSIDQNEYVYNFSKLDLAFRLPIQLKKLEIAKMGVEYTRNSFFLPIDRVEINDIIGIDELTTNYLFGVIISPFSTNKILFITVDSLMPKPIVGNVIIAISKHRSFSFVVYEKHFFLFYHFALSTK